MRFRGKEYDGEGITIAVIDSGINASDPRLADTHIEGWSISLGATGHALLGADFHDENGHGPSDLGFSCHLECAETPHLV